MPDVKLDPVLLLPISEPGEKAIKVQTGKREFAPGGKFLENERT